MTATVTETVEALDLSDLDLLDDLRKHIFCLVCSGGTKRVGLPTKALCGAVALPRGGDVDWPEDDDCPECATRFYGPCPGCGA